MFRVVEQSERLKKDTEVRKAETAEALERLTLVKHELTVRGAETKGDPNKVRTCGRGDDDFTTGGVHCVEGRGFCGSAATPRH